MTLKCMEQRPLDPKLMICPFCQEHNRLGIHSHTERRYICHACRRTFADRRFSKRFTRNSTQGVGGV